MCAVVLITGCSQPNSNKGNTGNNSGNISNNDGSTGNNGGNNGGGTSQGLEGGVFKIPDSMVSGAGSYYMYFSGGIVYSVAQIAGKWSKSNAGATYQGNTISYTEQGVMKSSVVSISQNGITANGYFYSRITDQSIINTIKNLPVSS